MFRGQAAKEIEVFTENSSARLPLEPHREYLLFAARGDQGLEITGCGNSGPTAERGDQLRALRTLAVGPTVVEGNVAPRPGRTGIAGVRFTIRGSARSYSAVSDNSGWFRVVVPPGRYSVQAQSPGVEALDLSNDDPMGFSVRKGQCAQLQFIRRGAGQHLSGPRLSTRDTSVVPPPAGR